MRLPDPLRRLGAIPGLLRLVSLVLECLSIIIVAIRHQHDVTYTTDYMIIGYIIAVDVLEIACLCCQPRGWPLAPLPLLFAADTVGLLMLVCSRDWYGLWYWHGPFYSLAREIGMMLFVTLPIIRILLVSFSGLEYWYDCQEDRFLPAERRALLYP